MELTLELKNLEFDLELNPQLDILIEQMFVSVNSNAGFKFFL
jgi:hypothetical protein